MMSLMKPVINFLTTKIIKEERVSDWCLMPNQQFFSYYQGENKLIFNEMMMRSTLY